VNHVIPSAARNLSSLSDAVIYLRSRLGKVT
jgi:hypothetical protein